MAFDVFSSVKGGGLLDDMVARWYQELQERGESSLVPWKTIEAYFDSIPLVCAPTKDSVANQFARYVKVMDQLKTIIRSAVYLTFSDEERTPYFVAHRQLKANFEVPDHPPPPGFSPVVSAYKVPSCFFPLTLSRFFSGNTTVWFSTTHTFPQIL